MDSLGLSIGATNMVAVRTGRPPVRRRSVLTLFGHRPAEVGLPTENAKLSEPGVVVWGFTDRVGDRVPMIAPDGSSHDAATLAADALESLVRDAGGPAPRMVIAVPAHWRPAAVSALRAQVQARPTLSGSGAPTEIVRDNAAALTALGNAPGLPGDGVVVLVDLGGTGTTVTLADAAAGMRPIGPVP